MRRELIAALKLRDRPDFLSQTIGALKLERVVAQLKGLRGKIGPWNTCEVTTLYHQMPAGWRFGKL